MNERRAGPTIRWPQLGFGAGLRAEHYDDVLSGPPEVEWFEASSENYMETGGRPLAVLESVRRDYPVALHGVSLSIGGANGVNKCKGTGDCGGKGHSCAGETSCKGQGYLRLDKEICLKIEGGRLTPEKK